jgi:hypothetical protein
MKISIAGSVVTATKEPNDHNPREDSSVLWTAMNNLIANHGHKLVFTKMAKDGHHIYHKIYYARSEKKGLKKGKGLCTVLWDSLYATRDLAAEWRKVGIVELELIQIPWDQKLPFGYVPQISVSSQPPRVVGGRICPEGSV